MYSIAFYKGRKTGNSLSAIAFRFMDWLTRKVTKGEYSHCELVKPIGSGKYSCFSASYRDGGVRNKIMTLNNDWVLIPVDINSLVYDNAVRYHAGDKYDVLGAAGVVLRNDNKDNQWFCSELIAHVIGLKESWRYDPNTLYDIVSSKIRI